MYSCPKCKSRMEVLKTFNQKLMFECPKCGLEDIVEYRKNHDEAFLEFLNKFDSGKILVGKKTNTFLEQEGIVNSEMAIKKMVGETNLDNLTHSILFSKKHFVSYFKTLSEPDPKMGISVKNSGLDDKITRILENKGIEKFYKFQDEAILEILRGNNLVITAPTASGKTEAFVVPIIQKILGDNFQGRVLALFVYPTKSLSKDQYPKIKELANSIGINVEIFDGDTKIHDRNKIFENPPQILITNFDVIHYHLWHRTKFATLINSVKFLAVDEAHVYSGIFGSNVHYIIKRLKRICQRLQIIASSATLENALPFCEELFGVKMKQVSGSGRKGKTNFSILFPSLKSQRALMVDVLKKLASEKHKTLVFSNSHLNSELIAIQARNQKIDIKVHRAGLMANYRKSVENAFKNNSLMAISATPTLELGIDVGDVDGVISSTIPVNRLIQRIGRAARKGQNGYAFLILGNDPISQYYKNHPLDYFDDVEKNYIDPKNPFVEDSQVLAMAADKPIVQHELKEHKEVIENHLALGNLVWVENRIVPNFSKVESKLNEYNIRGIGNSIDIFFNQKKVGDRILPIALEELHESAVYFLAGNRYKVKELGYPQKLYANLEYLQRDYPYYTKSLTEEWPTIESVFEKRNAMGIEVFFCKLHIQKRVYGYVNIELGQEVTQGKRVLLERPLDFDFVTKGIVFKAPKPIGELEKTENKEYLESSSYHATEHVVIEGSNMITGGVSQDLGGISLGTSGLIFVYDSSIGGNGASKALYDRLEKAFARSLNILRECPCKNEAGCPRCTFSYRCGNNNEYLHKHGATEVLQRINEGEVTEVSEPVEGDKPLV